MRRPTTTDHDGVPVNSAPGNSAPGDSAPGNSAPGLLRIAAVLLALLTPAVGLAACSSDDDTGSNDDTSSDDRDDGQPSTVDPAVLGEPDPASGEPVVIGFGAGFGDEGQAEGAEDLLEGAEVAVQYQNEYRGGLAGRPIELLTCDMGALPETAIDCANQFVDEGVTAVIAPVTSNGGSAVPIVTGAGIPYVSFAATSLEELASDGAFSIAGGGAAALGTVALDAAERGYETVSHVLIDVPQITVVANQVGDPVFEAAGVKQEVILAPLGVPDLTSQLSTATGDAILISGDPIVCASALQAYQTLGLDTPLYVQPTCITDDIADSLPGIFEGVYLASSVDGTDDEVELLTAMIQEYGTDASADPSPVRNGSFATGASTIVSFAGALDGITEPTGDAILEGMESAGVQPLFLGDPVMFDCGEPILDLASSLCSVQGHIVTLDADLDVTESQFYDPTELFETALSG